ncbi:MAG: cytochrome b6-f complex subunit PetM, partial [Cyanobacteriota bacterium]
GDDCGIIAAIITNPIKEQTMTAESMLANGAFILMGLTLVGLAWGFVIIRLQGSEE